MRRPRPLALLAPLALAACVQAGSRGANGIAPCGADYVAVADSAADCVVIVDPRRSAVVDVVPLPYGVFAHGVACLAAPTADAPGVILVTAQHGGHVFAAAYDENRRRRLDAYAPWFATHRPNDTFVRGAYAVDSPAWRTMKRGPKGLALHRGVVYLPFESRNTIIALDAAEVVALVTHQYAGRRLALEAARLVWVNATSARVFASPRKPYALAVGPFRRDDAALYVLGVTGLHVLNLTDEHEISNFTTRNMHRSRALAVRGKNVYLLVNEGYSSSVEAHVVSRHAFSNGQHFGGGGHGAGDGCGRAASFARPHSITVAGDALWVADMDNRAARRIDAGGCTSTVPYRTLLRRFHDGPDEATPVCARALVPTAAAARAACAASRLCAAAELRAVDGAAWAAGDCGSCFSLIAQICHGEPWGADHAPLVTTANRSTRLECLPARDPPPPARACCCGPPTRDRTTL